MQTPNAHAYDITDSSLALESNYCRNPDTSKFNANRPWCFKSGGTGAKECSLKTEFDNLPKFILDVKVYHCRSAWVDGVKLAETIFKELFELDPVTNTYIYINKIE